MTKPPIAAIGVGWWNAGIVPPRGKPKMDRWPWAKAMLLKLLESGIMVLGVGELSESLANEVISGVPSLGRLFAEVGGRSRRQIGFFFRQDRIEKTQHVWVTDSSKANPNVHGVQATFVHRLLPDRPVEIVAVHWPSRLRGRRAEHRRAELAISLRKRVEQLQVQAPTVVMGDFNDEPFDESLQTWLRASRDRDLVRSGAATLYNPFWRKLGEREHLESEGGQCVGAGTYFYRDGLRSTNWYTFDQIMVSKSMLIGTGAGAFANEGLHPPGVGDDVLNWSAQPLRSLPSTCGDRGHHMNPKFRKAFSSGLAAARNADRALAEIRRTFAALNEAVGEMTEGRITMTLQPRDSLSPGRFTTLTFSLEPPGPPKSTGADLALVASGGAGTTAHLANVSYGAAGFPVTVSYEDEQVLAGDRENLEGALAQLLQHPGTGRRIALLLESGSAESKD